MTPGPDELVEVDLARPWTTATVAEVGGSPAMVERGIDRARTNHRMRSLLVARNGRLVVEEYFGGARANTLHDARSVTKSVVSALTGIALERGDIKTLDDPVADYLGSLVPDLDPDKGAITIRQLLTMTSGLEWDETGGFGSYIEWIRSDDPLGYVLARPFAAPPGEEFNYNSAAVHLLGVVVQQATGSELPTLARSTLFDPMGISRSPWEPLGNGFWEWRRRTGPAPAGHVAVRAALPAARLERRPPTHSRRLGRSVYRGAVRLAVRPGGSPGDFLRLSLVGRFRAGRPGLFRMGACRTVRDRSAGPSPRGRGHQRLGRGRGRRRGPPLRAPDDGHRGPGHHPGISVAIRRSYAVLVSSA
ncbi:MAG: serine hydrolase [Gemmatimonadetes bacterium]|nr:serine hydrolase [Gemmatimonadota bacterium]